MNTGAHHVHQAKRAEKNAMSASGERKTRQQRLPAPQRQRGAVAVFVAAGLVALIASLMLVLNIGRLYYTQRQLQLDANMAALAGAQAGSGCLSITNGVRGNAGRVTRAVWQSLKNNTPVNENSLAYVGDPGGEPDLDDPPHFNKDASEFIATTLNPLNPIKSDKDPLLYQVAAGKTVLSESGITQTFVPLATDDNNKLSPDSDSVRVTLATKAPSPWWPMSSSGGTLYASATARRAPLIGTFSVAGTLATVDTDQSALLNPLLSGLLGTSVKLKVVDYQGLVQSKVSLADLIRAAPGVTDLHDLLTLPVDLPGALEIVGRALGNIGSNVGNGASDLVKTLSGEAASHDTSNLFGAILSNLGGALNPTVDSTLAAVPFVNGLQLIKALGMAASQGGPISIPLKLEDIPVVSDLTGLSLAAYLKVLDPPKFYVGPVGGVAKSSQVKLDLYLKIGSNDNTLSKLVGALATVNLGLQVTSADASGTLTGMQCPNLTGAGEPSATVTMGSDVAHISVGAFDPNADSDYEALASQHDGGLTAGKLVSIAGGLISIGLITDKTDIPVGEAIGDTEPSFTQFDVPSETTVNGVSVYIAKRVQPDTDEAYANPYTVKSGKLLDGISDTVKELLTKDNLDIRILDTDCGFFQFLCDVVDGVTKPLLEGITDIVGAIADVVVQPLTKLLSKVIDPLLQLLGVQVGQATLDFRSVSVGAHPEIVTNCLPLGGDPGTKGDGCLPPASPSP